MSEDFEAGLRDLHSRVADVHAIWSGLPIPAMVNRARRNRRIRTAAASAVATAAVVGVAWVGSAVTGLGDPAPLQPAEPTHTAVPGSYSGPACDTSIGDVPVFDEPPLVIELTLDDDALDPAEPLTGRVLLAVADGLDFDLIEFDGMLEGLDYTAVQEGVVVGYGRGALIDGTWQTLSGRQGVTALASIQLRPCDGASALAAGDYQLFASMPVTAVGGEEDDPPDGRTILGGPWPFTVAGASAPEPQSTGEPQAEGLPALNDLVISFDGLGPLRFVDPLPTSPGPTDVVRWDEQACVGTEVPGRWVDAYQTPAGTARPFTVWVFEDHVTRIDVRRPGPHTTQGIEVWSTLAEVQAAYPDVVLLSTAQESGEIVDAWALQDGERTLVFEVAANSQKAVWNPDQVDRVVAIAVLSGIPYNYPARGGELCG